MKKGSSSLYTVRLEREPAAYIAEIGVAQRVEGGGGV